MKAMWLAYWPAIAWFFVAEAAGASHLDAVLVGGLAWVVGRHINLAIKVDDLERRRSD